MKIKELNNRTECSSDDTYLGDSISVCKLFGDGLEGCLLTSTARTDQTTNVMHMDLRVLRKFLAWIGDNYKGELELAIAERSNHD